MKKVTTWTPQVEPYTSSRDIRPKLAPNQLITSFSLFPEVIIDLEKKGKAAENQPLGTWLALPVL